MFLLFHVSVIGKAILVSVMLFSQVFPALEGRI